MTVLLTQRGSIGFNATTHRAAGGSLIGLGMSQNGEGKGTIVCMRDCLYKEVKNPVDRFYFERSFISKLIIIIVPILNWFSQL